MHQLRANRLPFWEIARTACDCDSVQLSRQQALYHMRCGRNILSVAMRPVWSETDKNWKDEHQQMNRKLIVSATIGKEIHVGRLTHKMNGNLHCNWFRDLWTQTSRITASDCAKTLPFTEPEALLAAFSEHALVKKQRIVLGYAAWLARRSLES